MWVSVCVCVCAHMQGLVIMHNFVCLQDKVAIFRQLTRHLQLMQYCVVSCGMEPGLKECGIWPQIHLVDADYLFK